MSGFSRLSLLCLCLFVGCSNQYVAPVAVPPPTRGTEPTGTVIVEVVLADQTRKVKVRDVASLATVESIMQSVEGIPVEITGSGTNAFLHSIDGKATSGGKGWTYKVNGKFINEGIGSFEVIPPATIRWEFGEF